MSLNFQFVESIDRKLIEYNREDGSLHWHPRAQSFVFYQMRLQFNLYGEMTTIKLIEIDRRIRLMNVVQKHSAWFDFDGNGYRHQLADVITYWGLTTNVSHLGKQQWNAWFNRYLAQMVGITPAHQLRSCTELEVFEKPETYLNDADSD